MPKKIIRNECQGECPQCGGEDLNYDAMEVHDDSVCYPFFCDECHYEGKEWYAMKYIESV